MRRIHVSALSATLLMPALLAAQAPTASAKKGAPSAEAQAQAAQYAAADIRVLVPGIILNAGMRDLAAAYTKETGKKVAVGSIIRGGAVSAYKTANPPADVISLPFELM